MTSALRLRAALVGLILAVAGPAFAQLPGADHVKAQLVADHVGVQPGGTIHLALYQQIEAGWHTYWRNPGDSGEATELKLDTPAGWSVGPLIWAKPKTLRTGPLMDYGYEGQVILPLTLTAPASAQPGGSVTLGGVARMLVCKDVCVPQDAKVSLTLPVVAAQPAIDPTWGDKIQLALVTAPRPGPLTAAFTTSSTALKLAVVGAPVRGGDFPKAYFFPYDPSSLDQPQPQTLDRGPDGLTLTLAPGPAFKAAAPPKTLDGVLDLGGKAYEVDAQAGPPPAGAAGLGPPASAQGGGSASPLALGGAVVLAFLGGLILNLMPCVFPILSMKAVSLAGHGHDARAARLQGLAFMLGVVLAFLTLAGLLIGARAAGQAVGWGFQLQSPIVVAVLALVMFAVALNLSGLFEVGAGLQSASGRADTDKAGPVLGALLTGVLAVAVAAPCTAPFMAPAVGYALTQTPIVSLVVFLALGLGMAAPFTLVAFVPGLLRLMPRPGAWMAVFKKAMAFPMYAAAAWLLWVFSQQVGPLSLARLLAAAVVAALAAWLYGRAQEARFVGGRGHVGYGAASLLVVLALALAAVPPFDAPAAAAPATGGSVAVGGGPAAERFTPERLAGLRAQGKPVFVDLTAAWCVTCQVNDRLALSSSRVADAFHNTGMTYLKGDWTNQDPAITALLSQYGRAGVPLYLVYGVGGREAVVLPQILTEGTVLKAVQAAAQT